MKASHLHRITRNPTWLKAPRTLRHIIEQVRPHRFKRDLTLSALSMMCGYDDDGQQLKNNIDALDYSFNQGNYYVFRSA